MSSLLSVTQGDCLIFDLKNPYSPSDSYSSFPSFKNNQSIATNCSFSSSHEANCQIVSASRLQITFTKDNASRKITGQTTSQPFLNPFSTRKIKTVTMSFYSGCKLTNDEGLLIQGTDSISGLQSQTILGKDVTFFSSSKVIADELSNLIVTFQPKTPMKASGQLAISVPGWYVTDINNDGTKVFSADSVLDEESKVKILSHINFNITSPVVFDQVSRSIIIKYSGDQDVSIPFKLSISHYRNPVNTRPIAGFSLTTLDSDGNLINVSEKELLLLSNLTETASIGEREMVMLGDANGSNIGRIGTYQQISLYLQSQIPFEQDCYWRFIFPKTLKLDSNLSTIQGSGFFKPQSGNYISNSDFRVNLDENSISVRGCQDPSTLTSKPSGGLVFGVVKMPDYLIPISPLLVKAYDDASFTRMILQTSGDDQGFAFNADQLQPGLITLDDFIPSNYFAFVQNVNYTILFTPTHSMTNTTRITINMPENLIFDTSQPCLTEILITTCKFGTKKNQIILTDSFKKDFAGGQQLKVVIGVAQNPQGAREAGSWGIMTENLYNGTYYQVDGDTSKTSFYAKAGWIKSNILTVQSSTYSPSRIDLNLTTEHGVPNQGIVRVDLPKETVFANYTENSSGNSYFLDQSGELNYLNMTARYITFVLPTGHAQLTKPITFSLLNIITPRSFQTSSGFIIKSANIEGYVVDEGGQDITVTMSKMTNLDSISIIPMNSTNGLITSYRVEFNTSVLLKSGDIMLLKLPKELTVPTGVICSPIDKPKGVFKADCTNVANEIQIKFINIIEDIGNFQFLIAGIRNPASFRQTSTFRDIYFQTSDYFNTTQASPQSLKSLYVQMNNVALITNFTISQQTEEFGGIGQYEIKFTPVNQIGTDGVITFKWNDQVQLYNETACKIMTVKQFDTSFCQLDINNQQLIILGIFKNSTAYTGDIKIVLDKVRNPLSNRQVEQIEIRTFDDNLRLYPIDLLRIKPKLRCLYPCLDCGGEPNQCISCWQDDPKPFLMITELKSTCQKSCDGGWTTNGNVQKQCTRCESSCETCLDTGNVGDRSVCTTCGDTYNFFIPTSYGCSGPSCTGSCQSECPTGMYDGGNGVCMKCDNSCRTCIGNANNCKSCQMNSKLPLLFENRCVKECPPNFGAVAGVCFKCDSPCAACSTGPSICTSCDGLLGLSLSLGPTCVNKCPEGFITNSLTKKCEGCGSGCNKCDAVDNRNCLKCSSEFKLYQQTCVSDCPKGYMSNFDASECISMAQKDLKVVYFPFLVLTAILFSLSWIGGKVKIIHLVVPNFLVMMSFVENLSLLTQIVMTFRFGTWRYGIPIILAWALYVLANPVFSFFFKKKIAEVDIYYSKWAKNPDNTVTKNMLFWLGSGISWKFYKLLYSHFWGYNIKSVTIKDCAAIRSIQKWFLLFNSCTTYPLVLIMNFAGLIDMDWGTQLYICFIENLIIVLLLTGLGWWEQFMQQKKYLKDGMFEPLKKGRLTKLMTGALDTDEEINATKDILLKQFKENQVTTQAKFDELMAKFKGRECMSCCDLWYEKEEDPRRVHTWPNNESFSFDGPPEPIKDLFPDNVYADGLTAEQLFMINYLNKNLQHKNEQADKGFAADQTLRQEAELVANKRKLVMANEIEHSTEKKKQRGRKNRFFKQIDNEDNDAGALLDSDDEGNKKAKRAMDAEFKHKKELAAIKEEEEKEIIKQENEQRRKQKKMQALHLTEENFKLKQKLEQQRIQEQQDSHEFKQKLAEEEQKLQEIQDKIYAKSRENELRRESLLKAQQKKEEQKQDIQSMIDEEIKRKAFDKEVRDSVENARFLKEKAEVEKRVLAERYDLDLERKGTGLVQADGKIGQEDINSNETATNPHSQLYSIMDKPSISGAHESATQISPQHRSALEMTEPSQRIQMGLRRIECSSEIGEAQPQTPIVDEGVLNKSISTVIVDLISRTHQPGTPLYAGTSQKSKPGDRSHDNISNARADAVHMSMLQTDEASFMNEANQTHPLFFEPNFDYRCFNEIDIVGDLDRDDRGNVLLFLDERTQKSVYIDAKNNPINAYGYLIDKATGDIINNQGQKIFDRRDLDERGNIPMPFSIEKYNFNPFDLQGDFTFKDVNDPLSFNRLSQKDQDDNDLEFDDYGRQVNPQGFIIDDNGNLVDRQGLVRFDWRQFTSHGGLIPKLYNYQGRQFELHDVMGVFDRDITGKIKLNKGKDEKGKDVMVDKAGYMVNQKGYIINRDGNICTRQGKVLFLNKHLRDGEFPKIFPFTRFNINRVLGDFDVSADGQPILKVQGSALLDKQGRLVNKRGYLVDKNGNVIDIRGKLVFEKNLLEENGDIPEIFQINLLRSDSQSSLSRLMSEIDKEQQLFEEGAVGSKGTKQRPGHHQSDTSFESMMEDSPSKYDAQNQRLSNASAPADAAKFHISARWADGLPDDIQEESDGDLEAGEVGILRKRRKIKKKAPIGPYIVEEITDRDVRLAQAYGGEAKPRIRKTGQRFATVSRGGDRSNLQTAQQQSRPIGPKMQNLTKDTLLNNGVAIAGVQTTKDSARKAIETELTVTGRTAIQTQQRARSRGLRRNMPSNSNNMTSAWNDQHNRTMDIEEESRQGKKRSTTQDNARKSNMAKNSKNVDSRQQNALPQYDRAFEDEFEKLYKKDIDKFIDGSDFEVESLSGFSDISNPTFKSVAQNPKMREMEKVYLQRLEFQGLGSIAHEPQKQKKSKAKPRQLLDRFTDDPRQIARGEQTKMQSGPITKESPRRQIVENRQSSQSSLQVQNQPINAMTGRQKKVVQHHSPETQSVQQVPRQRSSAYAQHR